MDGFESAEGVIIVAATNRPDVLDPAMLRPGRFDRHVVVNSPDVRGREAILRVHARRILLGDNIELGTIARGTPGFSGADLENLVNEAALLAARRDADSVGMSDFELAKEKVLLGSERRSLVISDRERRMTAYHEAGHALVGVLGEHSDPVHKVTIVPRGRALGVTLTLPKEDRHSVTKDELLAMLDHMMGGRAAEEVVFDQFTTGASDDLKKATHLARDMVCTYGMSPKLGPISVADEGDTVFLGRDIATSPKYGPERAREIDAEIQVFLSDAYGRAKQLLTERRDVLDRFAEALLLRETLDGAELQLLVEGRELPPLPQPDPEQVSVVRPPVEEGDGSPEAPFGGNPEPIPSS